MAVEVGVFVAVGVVVVVGVAVGVGGVPPQPGRRKEPMRVCQGAGPVVARYSEVNQKVQSSEGSIDMLV